ncbi:tetratricopeptide repeat protein [Kitasatospora sp. NPDC001574]
MNIDDLVWQAETVGAISSRVALTLIEYGHLETVIQAALERGDWNCAKYAVQTLCADGEFDRALEVLQPFTATGWLTARWQTAHVMARQGRSEEALAMMRPDRTQADDERYLARYAELAASAGQIDTTITTLTPHLHQGWLLSTLVEVTEGQGRDERMLELLTQALARATGRPGTDPSEILVHTAQVLERAGRTDEATALLRAEIAAGRLHYPNVPRHFAALLARQGLTEELAHLAAIIDVVVPIYVEELSAAGRAAEAESLLRERLRGLDRDHDRVRLMMFLGRQGRIDEAVEVGLPACEDHDNGGIVHQLIGLLVDDNRPDRALQVLDNLTGWWVDGHPSDVQYMRLWLLGQAGRHTEALAHARTLPRTEPGEWDPSIADLLDRTGRTEEAVTLLRASPHRDAAHHLAEILARTGRPDEAIAAYPSIAEQRAEYERRQSAWKQPEPATLTEALAQIEWDEEWNERYGG